MKYVYEFHSFILDPENRLLLSGGERIPLTPKALDMLVVLAENSGQLMTKDELMHRVWPSTFVEEANLSHAVFTLRKTLGETRDGIKLIETIPRQGYRFVAPIRKIAVNGRSDITVEPSTADEQSSRYAGPDASSPEAVPLSAPGRLDAGADRKVRPFLLLALALTMVLASTVIFRRASADRDPASLTPRTLPLTSFAEQEFDSALSPDGNMVAFIWVKGYDDNRSALFLKMVGSGQPLQLTNGAAYDFSPAWSPDGHAIAFVRKSADLSERGIYTVPVLGGPLRRLHPLTDLRPTAGLDWSGDGKHIVFSAANSADESFGIFIVELSTGMTRQLTRPPQNYFGDNRPVISADSKKVLFVRNLNDSSELFLVPITGGKPKQITSDARKIVGAAWTPRGEIIFSSNRGGGQGLWRISPEGGTPVRVPVGDNAFDPSISRSGNRLTYTENFRDTNIWKWPTAGAGPGGTPVRLISSTRRDEDPRVSPDGTRIAFISDRSGNTEVWLSQSDGSGAVQLTHFGGPVTKHPRWSPDGRQIVLESRPRGFADIYLMSAEGGEARSITNADNNIAPSWSADGKSIYFASDRSGSWEIWKMPATGGPPSRVTTRGGYEAFESADGQTLLYTKCLVPGLFKRSAGQPEEKILNIPEDGTSCGEWTATRDGVFFIERGANAAVRVLFLDLHTRVISEAAKLDSRVPPNVGLNVSSNSDSLILAKEEYRNLDLMLVENFQ